MAKESQARTEEKLLRRVRREAAKEGERIKKFGANSKWSSEFGPFAIEDGGGNLIAWGIDSVDAVAKQYGLAVDR